MSNTAKPLLSALAAAVLLAGCSLSPTYERPDAPVPDSWSTSQHKPTAENSAAVAELNWQAFIINPELKQLAELALENNRDLRQTLLNVEAVRNQYRIQRSERLPDIQLEGGGTRQRVPADLRGPGTDSVQSSYQAGVGLAAYELDLFGRVRSLSEAALQEYLATEEAAQSAQISLLAEVTQTYLLRAGAQQRLLLAEQILEAHKSSLQHMRQRLKWGAATELDVQETLNLVQQVEVERVRIEREFQLADNLLALLVGTDIQPYLTAQAGFVAVSLQQLAAGVPSELLVNRPDIRAAEHRLQGRNANIGAARAAFFPSVALTGMYGSASAEFSDLFSSGQRAWSFAPQITIPIFNAGRNRANLDLAKLRKDMAVAAYEQSIQNAFREVSDALVSVDTLQREEAAQQVLVDSSAITLRLSEARYHNGADDHLRYLDAQRNDFANQMALVGIQTQRQVAQTALFRALGGAWDGQKPAP